jgi:hypothetical protein
MDLIIDVNLMYEDVPDSNVKVSYIVKDGKNVQPFNFIFKSKQAFCSDELADLINSVEKIYIFDSQMTIDFLLSNSRIVKEKLSAKIVDIINIYPIKPKKGRYIRMLALNTFIQNHDCALLWMLQSAQEMFHTEFYNYDTRYTVVCIMRIVDAIIPEDDLENIH